MRDLTATLLAVQKKATHVPFVKLEAKNKAAGVVRYHWERLYQGSEDDYHHALTMPSDGSMIRVRITPLSDSRKLYRQRVANPGPSSDFSSWSYTSQYNCIVVTAASLGSEVSIFWINSSKEIRRIKSTDYGVNWNSPELLDYSATTAVSGLAAAYTPSGDLAIFFTDQSTLYVKKHVGGSWQAKSTWDKTTGDLSGVAAVYDGDWNLLVAGVDSSGDYKLWSLIYGDGGDLAAGDWSTLEELVSAPSDGDFEYQSVFLDKPDVYRCYYIEKFTGTEAYSRLLWSFSVPGSRYIDSLWHEPVPFDLSSEYGVACAHHGSYGWLSTPFGVWRAELSEQSTDLTADILSLKLETDRNHGKLTVELRNDDGRYATLPSPLVIGCHLAVEPGYVTSLGNEVSTGQVFTLQSYEYLSSGNRASLILYARDGWTGLDTWVARHQFRWNKASDDKSVKEILESILARVGLQLEVKSQSAMITSYYPDFAIHPDSRGDIVVRKLLSFVPDVLFVEGNKACLVNPQATDNSLYSYGQDHPIFDGRYQEGAWEINRVQVEGYDPIGDQAIIVDSFSWSQISLLYDRWCLLEDRNIDTVTKAEQRGGALLREAEMAAISGAIRIHVNCGQQLYDVIDITDNRAGLSAVKKRVLGLSLTYHPRRGEYQQWLSLGAV